MTRDLGMHERKPFDMTWEGPRMERMEHVHLFQRDRGVPGCPACESIDPHHMTMGYVEQAWYTPKTGGWL